MTPQVIEVRLLRPRPDLLKLFAQPELALWRSGGIGSAGGAGPMRIVSAAHRSLLLRPAFDRTRADPEDHRTTRPEDDVRLIGERAARAIVRFVARDSDYVTGGTFADWPLLSLAQVAPANLRLDPAVGLFGFAIASRDGFLADPGNRAALNGAIDRAAVTAAVMPGWETAERILPESLDSGAPPAIPGWALLSPEQRIADASGAGRRVWCACADADCPAAGARRDLNLWSDGRGALCDRDHAGTRRDDRPRRIAPRRSGRAL